MKNIQQARVLFKSILRRKLFRYFIFIVILVFALAFIYSAAEGIPFHLGFYWATDTITNTGTGLVPPTQEWTWYLTSIFMWLGLGLTLLVIEYVYARFLERSKEERIIHFKNHTLLIGWNPKMRHFLQNLPGILGGHHEYVLIADLNERPFDLPKIVEFIKGNPVEERVLTQALAEKAEQAIIVVEHDANAVLTAMGLQSMNSEIKISANLIKKDSIKHLERIGVLQVVCDEQLMGDALITSFYKNQEKPITD